MTRRAGLHGSRRTVWTVAGALTGLALAPMPRAIAAAALLGGCGQRLADIGAQRTRRLRASALELSMPDALDLLAVCAIGGMGIDPALRLVASAAGGPAAEVLRGGVRALDVGLPREAAYEEMVRLADGAASVRGLAASLKRSERYGVPLAGVLTGLAADARERRYAAVRERALSAPVRMLFPLTLCFLPAFILLALAPAVLVALRSFSGP